MEKEPERFKIVTLCDKKSCRQYERVVFCFNYGKYHFRKCHFYGTEVSDLQPKGLEEKADEPKNS